MVESPNNYENLNPQTESNENSEFLESINNDLQSIPEELQNLAQKQVENYKESPQSSNDEYDLLDSIDALKAIESIKDSNDGYDEFIDLLNNSENIKPLFTKIIMEPVAINNYIKENGFPINQETLDAFNSNFGLDVNYIKEENKETREEYEETREEYEETREEYEETRQEHENKNESIKYEKNSIIELGKSLEEHSNMFSELTIFDEKNNQNITFLGLIEELENGTNNEREDVIRELLSKFLDNQENLNKILSILQEIDKEKGVDSNSPESSYSKFTSKLIELNPDFQAKIDKYEKNTEPEPIIPDIITDSETARIYAGLGTENPDINGNIFKNGDISIDISKRPPQRILGDENFNIELDLPIGDFYPAILEHERTKQEITPKLDSVNILLQNKEYIDDMLGSNLNISQIKTNLKNTLNIKTDFINTKEDLSDTNLANLKNEFEQQLNQSDEKLQQALREKINEYRKKLEQKDKLARETYDFLKSIGFDKIPQSVTNNVIQQLNSNSGLRASLGLNTNIDLKNGILGFDSDFDENNISSQEKADFAKVFNVMIAGNENGPINIDAVLNDRGTPISDYTVFENHLESNKLRDAGLANKIMIDNIKNYNNNEN